MKVSQRILILYRTRPIPGLEGEEGEWVAPLYLTPTPLAYYILGDVQGRQKTKQLHILSILS